MKSNTQILVETKLDAYRESKDERETLERVLPIT